MNNEYTNTELAKIRFSKIQLLSVGDKLYILQINSFYDSAYLFRCKIEDIYSEKNHKIFVCQKLNLGKDLIKISEFNLCLAEELDLYAKI